jgi:hypothetical protein
MAFGAALLLGVGLSILLGLREDDVQVNSVERVERLFGLRRW